MAHVKVTHRISATHRVSATLAAIGVAAACGIAGCGIAGCTGRPALSSESAAEPEPIVFDVAPASSAFESLPAQAAKRVKAIEAERLEAGHIEAERRAREFLEAERQKAQSNRSWRERFPTDDYSNTLLIGDSIMQQTKYALEEALPGVEVNADSGRSLETGGLVFENADPDKGVLDHVRNDEGEFDRYVIGTGNNDYAGMPLSAAEEIIECLGEDKEIYFITEIVTGNKRGTETTNETIDEVVDRYPNVHKIDWHDLVEGDEDEFLIDGCHPRPECYEDYAQCIKEALDEIH